MTSTFVAFWRIALEKCLPKAHSVVSNLNVDSVPAAAKSPVTPMKPAMKPAKLSTAVPLTSTLPESASAFAWFSKPNRPDATPPSIPATPFRPIRTAAPHRDAGLRVRLSTTPPPTPRTLTPLGTPHSGVFSLAGSSSTLSEPLGGHGACLAKQRKSLSSLLESSQATLSKHDAVLAGHERVVRETSSRQAAFEETLAIACHAAPAVQQALRRALEVTDHTSLDMREAIGKAARAVSDHRKAHEALIVASDDNDPLPAADASALRDAIAEARRVLRATDAKVSNARPKVAAAASDVQKAVLTARKESPRGGDSAFEMQRSQRAIAHLPHVCPKDVLLLRQFDSPSPGCRPVVCRYDPPGNRDRRRRDGGDVTGLS